MGQCEVNIIFGRFQEVFGKIFHLRPACLIEVKLRYLFILLLILCLNWPATAQSGLDERAFRSLSPAERYRFIHDFPLLELDSAAFLNMYAAMYAVATEKKDHLANWVLRFYYFQQRRRLRLSEQETFRLLAELEEMAKKHDFEVEQMVVHHFVFFEGYDRKKIPPEQFYVAILKEFGEMEELGFDKFKDYNIARILYHSGRHMYELEDFEKALQYLSVAERFIQPDAKGLQTTFLVLNYIQSIYQQQKAYDKGIEYAKKILAIAEAAPSDNPEHQRWYREWRGIAYVDIASMLVGQGKFAEGESFADKGYEQVKADDESGFQTEFEALLVLVPTKLELGKTDEAAILLKRLEEIHSAVGNRDYFYFKNIRFFEAYAKYHEMKGDYAAAVRYANFAKPLQDSLDRRNDARRLEKIQQRIAAEKYTEQLKLVESEKQLQTMLRNAAIVIMLLMGGLAYGNYKRLQHKRKQAAAELEAARGELETFTQSLREKSELAENLRLELDKLSRSGERSEYLEKLTRSTILTDDDWSQFRSIFEKVHPNFIETQRTQYPDLTQAELRYLVLEKLQLTTHEMANMLGVSDGTIRQTKMRMKKKIGN